MYYPELARYAISRLGSEQPMLAIGWLDKHHEYAQGPVSTAFVERLWAYCQSPVLQSKGFHTCEFCRDPEPFLTAQHGDQTKRLGSAEIWVSGQNGVVYAVPDLIYHYVVEHSYLPPTEFIEAVLYGTALSWSDVAALYR